MRNRYIFLETPGTREGGSENTYTMECGKFLDQVGFFIITFSIVIYNRTSHTFPGKLSMRLVLLTPVCTVKLIYFVIIFADPDADLNNPGCGSGSACFQISIDFFCFDPDFIYFFLDKTLARSDMFKCNHNI
jgi:hypothetical protein